MRGCASSHIFAHAGSADAPPPPSVPQTCVTALIFKEYQKNYNTFGTWPGPRLVRMRYDAYRMCNVRTFATRCVDVHPTAVPCQFGRRRMVLLHGCARDLPAPVPGELCAERLRIHVMSVMA